MNLYFNYCFMPFMIFAICILMIWVTFHLYRARKVAKFGKQAIAEMADYSSRRIGIIMTVKFLDQNNSVVYAKVYYSGSYKAVYKGAQFTILYNPMDPTEAVVENERQVLSWLTLFHCTALVIVILPTWIRLILGYK